MRDLRHVAWLIGFVVLVALAATACAQAPGSEGTLNESPLTRGAGPLTPVAPRRTAVAAVVRPADHSLPCAALHSQESRKVTAYSRMPARSSVWGGLAAEGAGHIGCQGVPSRAIYDHTFGLQNDCSRRFERRV